MVHLKQVFAAMQFNVRLLVMGGRHTDTGTGDSPFITAAFVQQKLETLDDSENMDFSEE